MTFPLNPADREPKGDHNRRIGLGLSLEQMAAEAGVTVEALREYEMTSPDHKFDLLVAERVGAALDRLEAHPPASQQVQS
ncbi:XRE family transcriptional regulator [Arsenicitalea aurantiaca]|uniref:XRE family transcriptional regulator n=1 Tax=Arsenicitalea aurantiaca TaxID=1783274 RepID=A0A433XG17_9HYPH|nr:helix-turn-helix transcriptional regulator [Arsenicitalea aurantiaca]RUT33033.1 XRE family transcriptional regulator [Arsenicitalea aurantiaca]